MNVLYYQAKYIERLNQLQATLTRSEFFATHEVTSIDLKRFSLTYLRFH